jgi:transcriptional regulator with XRE-family HTH domain
MNRVQQIAQRLQQTEVTISEVSRLSGVSRPTILDIRDGKTTNPGFLTVTSIEGALDALEPQPVEVPPQ